MFDGHCHLDDPGIDLGAALAAMDERGVRGAIVAGYGPERLAAGRELCAGEPRIRLAAGLHPWWFAGRSEASERRGWRALRRAALSPDIVAVGEVGMDRHLRRGGGAGEQRARMETALGIARDAGKPVILHVVGWHGHALAALDAVPPAGGVVHRFSGSVEVLEAYLERSLHVSVDVVAMRRRPGRVLDTARRIPLHRLLLETDWPERERGYSESLAELWALHEAVARVRGTGTRELIAALETNNRRLYGL